MCGVLESLVFRSSCAECVECSGVVRVVFGAMLWGLVACAYIWGVRGVAFRG